MVRPLLLATITLTACAPTPTPPEATLPFFGTGYRADGDPCRRIGEDDFTNQFLDHTADLVGCPQDTENLGVFVTETGAVEVARKDGYILYSIPRK